MRRAAFSLVEVLVACVVVGLAAVPMLGMLSSSNRTSRASVFEIMAVQYAEELGEQLLRLSQRLKAIREVTGESIKTLLEDPQVVAALNPQTPPAVEPGIVRIPGTEIVLLCSPLNPNFLARVVKIEQLDTAGKQILKNGIFWSVTIGLAWRMTKNDPVIHNASFSLVLREDS